MRITGNEFSFLKQIQLSVIRIIWILVLVFLRRSASLSLVVLSLGSGSGQSHASGSVRLAVDQTVAVHVERGPVLAPAVGDPAGDPLVQVVEDHLLVLLQELPGELGQDLQEGHVRRRSCWIVGVLQRIDSNQNTINKLIEN